MMRAACFALCVLLTVGIAATVSAHPRTPGDFPGPIFVEHPDRPQEHQGPHPWGWYVVRRAHPTSPVYGPYLSPEPECGGYARRYPFYACVRLP
jgi:hypothetical protein